MAIVRVSPNRRNKRVLAFRAWHYRLEKMVKVNTADFDNLDGDAEVAPIGKGKPFKAKMHELVLLQDTNFSDAEGDVVYEGDIVYVRLQNLFGSWEETVAEVVFDDESWGYSLDMVEHSGLPGSGGMEIIRVIGNVYNGVDNNLLIEAYEKENGNKGSKKTRRCDQ